MISNEEMKNIMKIVKSIEKSGVLVKGLLSMLLGTLTASSLGNALSSKGVIKAGEGTIRAGQDF